MKSSNLINRSKPHVCRAQRQFGFPLSCILSRQPARHNSRYASSPPLRFGPSGVRSGTQPTVVVAKGKNPNCRVSRAVRIAKEFLRLKTMQLGRWKEFRHSQVRVRGVKNSFAPKGFLPFLASQTSERKPNTTEFPSNFLDSEYGPRQAKLWHRSCHVGPAEIFGLDQPMNVFESVDRPSVIIGPSPGARFSGQIGVPIS